MKVLVCGDRNWQDIATMYNYLDKHDPPITIIIEGACRGADLMGGQWAKDRGILLVEMPAEWKDEKGNYRPWAGPERNGKMLDEKPDLVLAFHNDIKRSKGTRNCLRQASIRKIPFLTIESGKGIVS